MLAACNINRTLQPTQAAMIILSMKCATSAGSKPDWEYENGPISD